MVKYAPRTSTAAVAKAKSWVGKSYPPGWCQKWTVGEIFGTGGVGDWDGDRAADAEDGWKAAVANGRVVHARDITQVNAIPAGVALYWTGGRNDHGHAAVSAGNGYIFSTDLPTNGRVGKVRIEEVRRRWGYTFVGYVVVTGNGYTLTDKPSGPIDKMDPANYGPGKSGPHILWYGQRLEAHGFGEDYTPTEDWGPADERQTAAFQRSIPELAGDADGLPGRRTLELAATDPPEAPVYRYPADIFGKNWKLTIPFDGPDADSGADEIRQPRLATYSSSSCRVNTAGDSVVFTVHHGAPTTSGSKNPRSELREMRPGGLDEIEWDGRRGRHRMAVDLSVNHLTVVRPHVVVAQIHDADDDLTVLRCEGVKGTNRIKVWITRGDSTHAFYVGEIKLTERFKFAFDVKDGKVRFDWNGRRLPFTVAATAGCYFKSGCYVQSNPASAPSESTKAYAQVRMFSAPIVTHAA